MAHWHSNPMMPYLATIINVRDLATGIKLLQVELDDPEVHAGFDHQPGQFAEVSAFGVGEAPFGICSTRERGQGIEFASWRALYEWGR